MKNHIQFLTPLCLALLAITSPARAEGLGDNDGDVANATTPAAKIILLEARTALTPPAVIGVAAAAAVVPPGPGGSAVLEAANVDGVLSAEVTVRTRGLAADTYTVAVKKKSSGASVTLGTFTIAPVTPPAGAAARVLVSPIRQGSIEFETGGKNPLPAGFDGFDVASISVSDSKSNVVLGGDLTTSSDRVTRVRLTPPVTPPAGAAAISDAAVVVTPTASGFVSVFSRTRAGVTTSHFSLIAKGLPASADLTLALNGADVQPATTSAAGRLRVRTLPETVDIAAIKTVEIHDAKPAILLSGSL